MWFLILFLMLAGAFTIGSLLVIALGQLLGRDFPFLMWLALGSASRNLPQSIQESDRKVGA